MAREAYQAAFDAAPDAGRRQYLELKLRSVPGAAEAEGSADAGQDASEEATGADDAEAPAVEEEAN